MCYSTTRLPLMASQELVGAQALYLRSMQEKVRKLWLGFSRLWLELWKARNRERVQTREREMIFAWEAPPTTGTHGGLMWTREATRGRPGPPKCPLRAAMQNEVHISFIRTSTRRFREALDWGTLSRLCPSMQSQSLFMEISAFSSGHHWSQGEVVLRKPKSQGIQKVNSSHFWGHCPSCNLYLPSIDIFVCIFS